MMVRTDGRHEGPAAAARIGRVRPRHLQGSSALIACALLTSAGIAAAQPVGDDGPEPSAPARRVVEEVKVFHGAGNGRTVCERVPHPLLQFGDPARANTDGTVWAWGTPGRPEALLELYFNDQGSRIQVVSSLSGRSLTVEGGDGFRWTPEASRVTFQPAPASQAPAGQESARLRQMKEIARGLTAHEFWDPDNQRYELRLLPQPVHRYSDPDGGLLDGALFVFAHGTNPEVVLLVEAHEEGDTRAWKCGFARLGHAEMHVRAGEEDVWSAERVDQPDATEPYWLFYKATPAEGE